MVKNLNKSCDDLPNFYKSYFKQFTYKKTSLIALFPKTPYQDL